MAINLRSHGPTLRCNLLHLLVLITFATTAHSRDVAQDIKVNIDDLQAKKLASRDTLEAANTTSQVALHSAIGTSDEETFNKARDNGNDHMCMLARNDVEQSLFTEFDSLEDSGWYYTPGTFGKAPLPADQAEVYDDLGISKDNPNNPIYHWRQDTGKETELAYGDIKPGQPFGQTNAAYQNQINPKGGMLMCLNNFGPAYKVSVKEGEGPVPPLNKLSDVLWLQWKDAVQLHSDGAAQDLGNIKWFYQHIVADADSIKVMSHVQAMPGHLLKPYPGEEYSMEDADPLRRDIARAFLGSHNRNVVAYFLAQHRKDIRKKLTVSKVRFFGNKNNGPHDRHFLFFVEPVTEAAEGGEGDDNTGAGPSE
ncbi:Mitochondrial import inner membrane translocase subunit tim8 [Elasticomyces elasticus]|nr:Mitochondrial import inner membrane translocase subunit tim8 [Elasticomyces elasticus]